MPDAVSSWFTPWAGFYVVVGSAGAALTGLQFVVMAVVAALPRRASLAEINTYGTPNVVHFCVTLLVSALLSAPWHGLGAARAAILLTGLGGLGYVAITARRAGGQMNYQPELSDWLWHVVFPAAAYGALVVASAVMGAYTENALFAFAGAVLVLLFVGIHNAWDTVRYVSVTRAGAD